MNDYSQILKTLYPEGSVGGQCGVFAEKLANFNGIGNLYSQKKDYVNGNGIIAANIEEIGRGYRVGDVIITDEGISLWDKLRGKGAGHVATIIDSKTLAVVESNFDLKGHVAYGRKVDPKRIYGIIRAPLKVDMGQCEINHNVFINNAKWAVGFLDDLSNEILKLTDNKLKVNFFPLLTSCKNWNYEIVQFPMDGENYKVIAQNYLTTQVAPLAFTGNNKPSDLFAFVVKPSEWEGVAFGKQNMQEIGWTNPAIKPAQVQIACSEFDISPFYAGMRLIAHALMHELSHYLHYINGMNDTTDQTDITNRQIAQIYNDLDWNRININK